MPVSKGPLLFLAQLQVYISSLDLQHPTEFQDTPRHSTHPLNNLRWTNDPSSTCTPVPCHTHTRHPPATAVAVTSGCSALLFNYPRVSSNINHGTARGWMKCKRASPPTSRCVFTPCGSHLLKHCNGWASPGGAEPGLQLAQVPPDSHMQVILS